MSNIKKISIALLILLGVVFLLPFLNVYGSANPYITLSNPTSTDAKALSDLAKSVNNSLCSEFNYDTKDNIVSGVENFLTYSESANKVDFVSLEVDMLSYKKLGQDEKQTTMQITLQEIENSSLSRTNKNKVYNYIADLDSSVSSLVRQLSNDVDAEFADAYSYFKPFSGVVGTILGFLALGIFVFLALTIVIDLAYIVIPGFQYFLSKSSKGEKSKWISLEAFNAIRAAESSNGSDYVHPLGFYFKSKTKQFIALSICLLYLVSGKIFILIANIMDYLQGFLPQ